MLVLCVRAFSDSDAYIINVWGCAEIFFFFFKVYSEGITDLTYISAPPKPKGY